MFAQVPMGATQGAFGAEWSAEAFRAARRAGPVQVELKSGRVARLRHAWGELMDTGKQTYRRAAGGGVRRRRHRPVYTEPAIEELVPFEVQRKERIEANQRKLQALVLAQV